jgi:hypothetical protein
MRGFRGGMKGWGVSTIGGASQRPLASEPKAPRGRVQTNGLFPVIVEAGEAPPHQVQHTERVGHYNTETGFAVRESSHAR